MAYTKEQISQMLEHNPQAVLKGLLAIYDNQTEDEKHTKETNHSNGFGFNSVDSKIMSSFAECLKRKGGLTEAQFQIARKRLIKYSGQLAKIANSNVQAEFDLNRKIKC